MKISKIVLNKMKRVYAVCSIDIHGKTHFLAAPGGHGECLLFSPPDWDVSTAWIGPGGTMGLVPMPDRKNTLIAIQEFFPIYKSENAGIYYAEVPDNKRDLWNFNRIIDLPFVHRCNIVNIDKSPYLIASTLCGGKRFIEDWSKPGAVYVGKLPDYSSDKCLLSPILEGIYKNHGMYKTTDNENHQLIFISGSQGIFQIKIPDKEGDIWSSERIIGCEVSDVCFFDVDNDEIEEMVTIEPFHGNTLVIYKKFKSNWLPVYHTEINFGHALWCGIFLGTPSIIYGSRGGSKELSLLHYKSGKENFDMEKIILDEGGAPAQITVVHKKNHELILVSNNGLGEVTLYKVKP